VDKIACAKFLTTIDLTSGYHQIRLAEESRHLTAFTTPLGLWEWCVLPFGLAQAPAAFQRAMNGVIRGYEEFVAVYIDDLVVFFGYMGGALSSS